VPDPLPRVRGLRAGGPWLLPQWQQYALPSGSSHLQYLQIIFWPSLTSKKFAFLFGFS
jgi:hypothetical protein